MHLKSVELHGFKTFARRTELLFEPGITAIVGPNGSGKSNLVDAVRWALGERSARELRGERMEEVVYSGGAHRTASGMAEVRLVLDNQDGRLAVPYSEIEIIRKGFRSGESQFWLNGARCRLRDIEELFASTGLTQQGYSVVAQDDVDHIIRTSPAERRALIEEAAGVRSLRAKRQEAVAKLREAEQNMLRLGDLVHELGPRVDELREQAEQARGHASVEDELNRLRGSLVRGEWLAARQRQLRAARRTESAAAAVASAREGAENFAGAYAAEKEKLAQAHDSRLNRERELGRLRLLITHAESRGEIMTERLRAAEQVRDTSQLALSQAEQRLAVLEEEREGQGAADAGTTLDDARRALVESTRRLDAALKRQQQAADDEAAARSAVAAAAAHASALTERVASLELIVPQDAPPAAGARRLVELIEAPAELRPALEAALGSELLDAWVVPDARAEARLIGSPVAFEGLVIRAHAAAVPPPPPPPPGADWLAALVTAPGWLRPALDALLADVYVVDGLRSAATLLEARPDATMVTLEGHGLTRGWLRARPGARLVNASARLAEARVDLSGSAQAQVAADEGLRLAQAEGTAAGRVVESERLANQAASAREAALAARAEAALGRFDRAGGQLAKAREEIEGQRRRAEAATALVSELEAELEKALAETGSARLQLDQGLPEAEGVDVDALTTRLLEMEKGHLERQVALAHLEDALTAARDALDTETAAVAELGGRLGDSAGEESPDEVDEDFDWERLQRHIVRLERQLLQMGPVNPLAPEAFDRESARLDAIASQAGDLAQARADLAEIEAELTAEIERRFEAVFGAVAVNFQELFGTLFEGGKATLQLEDVDGGEPGVEILAQPAGKRMRNIRWLSGGERALTALAFILALEKVTPSPFYIFDEVDAPLDDANVKRFNSMLRSMAGHNQFLLITHNHITMTASQALYGITLEDSGVSRVVSVRLAGEQLVEAVGS